MKLIRILIEALAIAAMAIIIAALVLHYIDAFTFTTDRTCGTIEICQVKAEEKK